MAFYVPLGPRGVDLPPRHVPDRRRSARCVYWRASRRRGMIGASGRDRRDVENRPDLADRPSDRLASGILTIRDGDRRRPSWELIESCAESPGRFDLTGTREFSGPPAPGHDRRRSPTGGPTTSSSTTSRASPSGPAGSRSSTSPAAGSRSPTRTARSGSPSTASCSSTPSCARSSSPAATPWPPAATPRPGSTSTRTSARGCSRRPGASSPSRSGTGANGP